MSTYLVLDLAWLVVLGTLAATAFGFRARWRGPVRLLSWLDRSRGRLFWLAFLLRLVPALIPVGAAYDVNSYLVTGQAVLEKSSTYASGLAVAHYPYLPLAVYVWAGAAALAASIGLPFVIIVKLPIILLDSLLAYVLARICPRDPVTGRSSGGLLYAVSPIAILVSAYHGQFDGAVLLSLVASFWLLRAPSTKRSSLQAGLLAGLSIALKPWPVVLIPYGLLRVRRWRQVVVYLGGMTLVMAGALAIYLVLVPDQLQSILSVVSGYRSIPGVWGLALLLSLAAGVMPPLQPLSYLYNSYGFLLLGASLLLSTALFQRAHWPWPRSCLGLFLVFMVVSNAFLLQYVLWLVPFAILARRDRELAAYTAVTLVWLVPSYFLWHMFPVLERLLDTEATMKVLLLLAVVSLSTWAAACWWLIREVGLTMHQERRVAVSCEVASNQ